MAMAEYSQLLMGGMPEHHLHHHLQAQGILHPDDPQLHAHTLVDEPGHHLVQDPGQVCTQSLSKALAQGVHLRSPRESPLVVTDTFSTKCGVTLSVSTFTVLCSTQSRFGCEDLAPSARSFTGYLGGP